MNEHKVKEALEYLREHSQSLYGYPNYRHIQHLEALLNEAVYTLYECPECGARYNLEEVLVSGFDGIESGLHKHCPKCGEIICCIRGNKLVRSKR